MRRVVLAVAVSLSSVAGAVGCATSSPDNTDTEEGAIGTPDDERASDDDPVWAEGPVDGTTPDQGADPDGEPKDDDSAGRDEPASEPGGRRERREPERASADGLDGVFPDETISLDFRQASIGRVLRIFKVKARIDIVLDSEVGGRITVSTEETPMRQAFEAILAGANLSYERRDEVLVVRPN